MITDTKLVSKALKLAGASVHKIANRCQCYDSAVYLFNETQLERYKIKAEEVERELRIFVAQQIKLNLPQKDGASCTLQL